MRVSLIVLNLSDGNQNEPPTKEEEMKAFLLGLFHVGIGGALVPVLNSVAHGNLSPTALGIGAAVGAAKGLLAYLNPSPSQQQ